MLHSSRLTSNVGAPVQPCRFLRREATVVAVLVAFPASSSSSSEVSWQRESLVQAYLQ